VAAFIARPARTAARFCFVVEVKNLKLGFIRHAGTAAYACN